ncbi:LOW QUALITY PROTEIN: reverse transcriptase [Phytophthora megakarya]|uniref:Reverse transcriptase n=1 Tax=Phytophthora megakarya TaxID=4795 RepID=A0A225VQT8_9STRA|nr:LOW QUALITY PROTEIN: reverse transcriptase [Phytophthora megakarya]
MSLGMASGFWAIQMTERVKLISAFFCPFGHFQWIRMPFGLKNAPLVYQSVINNCLWGIVRLPPEEEPKVDRDVLEFLLMKEATAFRRNIPTPTQMGPVLGRSSYIDDIAHGAPTWDKFCEDLNALLFRLRYWNISVSLPKSEFGQQTIPYLSHEVCAEGIRATPKIAKSVQDLPFPSTLKGVQSLNYYNKFIEDLSVVATVLYELDEDRIRAGHDLDKAKEAFEILKRRVLNESELRYHIAEKAIPSAHLRFRDTDCILYSALGPEVLTEVELGRRSSPKVGLGIVEVDSGITPYYPPREHLDEVAEDLIPAKGRIKAPPPISVDMLDSDFEGAHGFPLENVTVNDAKYHGLIKGLELASDRGFRDVVEVGDSRIVIQQAQGLIGCHQPNLQRRLAEYEALKVQFGSVRLVHVKRDYNHAADYLMTKTLALGKASVVEDADELMHLKFVSRILEKIMKTPETSERKDSASQSLKSDHPNGLVSDPIVTTRSRSRQVGQVDDLSWPLDYRNERWRRIKVHQDGDPELKRLNDYLKGDLLNYTRKEVKKIAKGSDRYVLDSRDVLYRLAAPTPERPRDKRSELRLVVPEALRPDILHHAYEDFQSGHQGITRTYERLRSEFSLMGMFEDVEMFVKECTDCVSAKGRPPNPGPSPRNIERTVLFEVVSMDFVTHLPKSERGNTFLLLFQDMFTGYVTCKPMSSTTAQACAEAYEEVVFRNYGTSSEIRHDRDPRFMSRVFRRFSEMMGIQQKATLAYRLQANGQQE